MRRKEARLRRRTQLLAVFTANPGRRFYSPDVARLAGIRPASVFVDLWFLELEGWLQSGWDPAPLPPARRYRRRQYWLAPLSERERR